MAIKQFEVISLFFYHNNTRCIPNVSSIPLPLQKVSCQIFTTLPQTLSMLALFPMKVSTHVDHQSEYDGIWYIHLLLPCSRATFYRRCLKFNYKYNMNFKTLKLYYKLCHPHYMFRPIWPSSGVKSYVKIALKTAALFRLCYHASRFWSIVHWYVFSCYFCPASDVYRYYEWTQCNKMLRYNIRVWWSCDVALFFILYFSYESLPHETLVVM
jgi:hypothetical protein